MTLGELYDIGLELEAEVELLKQENETLKAEIARLKNKTDEQE